MRRLQFARILCALVLFFTSGCGQKLFRAETQLAADGRVSRAIYQPADDTPESVRDASAWTKTTYSAEIRPEKWTGSIRDLPVAAADKEHPYFAAWGEFESPAKIPTYYLRPAPTGLPNGKLAVEYRREDFVFVVEHRWKETLTDVVTYERLQKGRREFVELVIPLAGRCLDLGLGPEYDTSGVVEWLKGPGNAMFVDLTDAFFEAGVRHELPPASQWKESMADVLARHGLKLRDDRGELLDEDRARSAGADFVSRILRERLRRRDGRPVPQSVIDDLVEWLNLKDASQAQSPRLARLDGLAKQVIAEQYGSQQKFAEVIGPPAACMLGLYRMEVLGPPRRFRFSMEMPGTIVETNGVFTGDNRVQWKFEAVEAYPFGFPMQCRSLVPQVALLKQLTGAQPLATRDQMLEFIAAVGHDFMLREALRNCVKQGKMQPLLETRARIAADNGDTTSFDTVIRLLGI